MICALVDVPNNFLLKKAGCCGHLVTQPRFLRKWQNPSEPSTRVYLMRFLFIFIFLNKLYAYYI
jgi:hypothetical protein